MKIIIRIFLDFFKFVVFGAIAIILPGCSRNKVQKRPNLVFIFADQFRRQAIGFMNEDPVITPNFNRFAEEGVVFTNAISACPLCSPFRAMLMTGRFPLSTGVTTNAQAGLDLKLDKEEICIGDVLKANGYHTGYIGKWHLECPSLNKYKNPIDGATWGWDGWTPPGPRRHGFDFWYAYNTFDDHFHPHYWTGENPQKVEIEQWSVEHETDVAIRFIKERPKDKPFALFISWNPPHPPFVAPDKYKKLYVGKELPPRKNDLNNKSKEQRLPYYSAVTSCDNNFGRILETLDSLGISDNTIVIFTADHGEMMGSHDKFGKNVWYEESIGIPFLIRWLNSIKPGNEDLLFASYNFMPTILGLMNLPIPETVEGTDYSKILFGKKIERPTSVFLTSYANPGKTLTIGQHMTIWTKAGVELREKGIDWRTVGFRGVRTERYTYVVNRGGEETKENIGRLLYDNEKDPYQLNPIRATHASEHPVMLELNKELRKWLDKMSDPFPLSMEGDLFIEENE